MAAVTVLIGGEGIAGCSAATTLALRGLGVTYLHRDASWSPDVSPELVERMRTAGVELRPATELVGWVQVDRHVEAELSDGRIENYDVIVVPVGEGARDAEPALWRVIAGSGMPHPQILSEISRTIEGLPNPA